MASFRNLFAASSSTKTSPDGSSLGVNPLVGSHTVNPQRSAHKNK
uniref:Uncharacterized protein n=1 Tax=Anguilla anguilla TaxID=7936 RepID=A0A0E9V4V3_ANGAN